MPKHSQSKVSCKENHPIYVGSDICSLLIVLLLLLLMGLINAIVSGFNKACCEMIPIMQFSMEFSHTLLQNLLCCH